MGQIQNKAKKKKKKKKLARSMQAHVGLRQ